MYKITYVPRVKKDLAKLKENEPGSFQKALNLINELVQHPRSGTGHPEQLTGKFSNQWSRRISKKHRLVYEIHDNEVVVLLLSAYGHYDDK